MKKIMALTMVAIVIVHHYPDDDDGDANSKTAMTSAISTLSCQVSPPPQRLPKTTTRLRLKGPFDPNYDSDRIPGMNASSSFVPSSRKE